jgi:hypothetical protein
MPASSAPKRIVRPKAKAATPVPHQAPSDDTIAARAYQLWLAEGCPDGRALAHWMQAQQELAHAG